MFDRSATGGDLIRSESYLKPSHDPGKPVGRNHEVSRIADAVRPLVRGGRPENLLVYGPAGVGKTSCVRYVLQELGDQTRVKTVCINCWQYNSRPSLLTELLIELGYPAPRKGKPVDELLSKAQEWLDKAHGVALALDEFDQLDEQAEVIYDLMMASKQADNPLGLVLVSNEPPSRIELDPRSESRLTCHTLEFTAYTQEQLIEILEERVEQAFYPGTVTDEAIAAVAAESGEQTGDCRQAFNLLLSAGREAERRSDSEVTKDIVREVAE